MALANVNLRAALGRRAVRHEPLGVDLDGRVYYSLNPRPIDEDGRVPTGWASGLLVWGNVPVAIEGIPAVVERWSHFGKSAAVKQLVKWLEWREKKMQAASSPIKAKSRSTPAKSIPAPTRSPHSGHPSATLVQSKLFAAKTSTSGRKAAFDIVIPTRKATSSDSSLTDAMDSGDESDTSELSAPPETTEDLLRLIDPVGYAPSAESAAEASKELVRKLGEVAEWLEVLEWKGLGEM